MRAGTARFTPRGVPGWHGRKSMALVATASGFAAAGRLAPVVTRRRNQENDSVEREDDDGVRACGWFSGPGVRDGGSGWRRAGGGGGRRGRRGAQGRDRRARLAVR